MRDNNSWSYSKVFICNSWKKNLDRGLKMIVIDNRKDIIFNKTLLSWMEKLISAINIYYLVKNLTVKNFVKEFLGRGILNLIFSELGHDGLVLCFKYCRLLGKIFAVGSFLFFSAEKRQISNQNKLFSLKFFFYV